MESVLLETFCQQIAVYYTGENVQINTAYYFLITQFIFITFV